MPTTRRPIGYPTNRMLAVIDDPTRAASALSERVVDKVLYFYAPKIIGGREAISPVGGLGSELVADAIQLDRIRVRRFGNDMAIEGYVIRERAGSEIPAQQWKGYRGEGEAPAEPFSADC